MQTIYSFANHHKDKHYKTKTSNPKSCGKKYRILENGEVILRFSGKILVVIDDKDSIEYLMNKSGEKLDKILQLYIDNKLPMKKYTCKDCNNEYNIEEVFQNATSTDSTDWNISYQCIECKNKSII